MVAQITQYMAICLALAGICGGVHSQGQSSAIHDNILKQILGLQFGPADSLLTAAGTDLDTEPGVLYLRNYLEFLDALVAGERSRYEKYLTGTASRLDLLQSRYTGSPGQPALVSAIHLQSAFLHAFHGENFRAARSFYVASRYYRLAESALPGDPLLNKLGGLIQLVAGSAPAEYLWLMRIFGIRGDVRQGLGQLVAYHGSVSGAERLESCLILLYARQLTGQEMPGLNADCGRDAGTLQRFFLAYQALRSGHSREAAEMLDTWQQVPGEAGFAYLDLLLGEALLNINQPGAGDQLDKFLERTRGQHLVKTAWHKLSWYHLLEGDTAAYRAAKSNVLKNGHLILEADRQAFIEASEDGIPNAFLLRSRLYFDGGDYQRSVAILREIRQGDLTGPRDSLEYVYRLARIADCLGNRDEAILKYREVKGDGMGSAWYFPSNAALHLGMIHEAMGDTTRAIESYQACLHMNRSAYSNSIGNKAKMGIKRLRQGH